MSCDWDLYCIDCEDYLGLSDWNHGDEACLELWKSREQIAAGAEVESIQIRATWRDDRIDPAWFLKHKNHNVRPKNEYGQLYNQCGERIICNECGVTHFCILEKNHKEQHSK